MTALIQVSNLTKNYGANKGIIDVTFEIPEGEVFGFLGPNGAGKTTTMRVLMGLLRPTAGRATIAGLDCWSQSTEVKRLVGYLPGEYSFDPSLNERSGKSRPVAGGGMEATSPLTICRHDATIPIWTKNLTKP